MPESKDLNGVYREITKDFNGFFKKKSIELRYDDVVYLHKAIINTTIGFINENKPVKWDYLCMFNIKPYNIEVRKKVKDILNCGGTYKDIRRMLKDDYNINQYATRPSNPNNSVPIIVDIDFSNANRTTENK